MLASPSMRNEITEWAISEGYAVKREAFRAWEYNEDNDAWSYILVATREDAFGNLEDMDDPDAEGPHGHSAIEAVEVVAGTGKLWRAVGAQLTDVDDAMDLIAIHFIAVKGNEILGFHPDGIWWHEDLAPERLSAPRGAIFPERLGEWSHATCEFNDVEDVEYPEAESLNPSL